MTLRLAKAALVLMLGFVLVWQGIPKASAGNGPMASHASCKCCVNGCGKCSTPVCCTKPVENHDPFAPASLPTPSPNEWHALAASASSWLTLPALSVDEFPSRFASSPSLTAVPLFQRDCCYLI
jgi:hypothetical protein